MRDNSFDNGYDHSILIDRPGGAAFVCNATSGSTCRLVCEHDCEDVHRAECDGSTKDGGMCMALPYLQAGEACETYIGTTQQPDWYSGLIDVEWNEHFEIWHWRYPLEDRQEPGQLSLHRSSPVVSRAE
ncbi:Uncharacterised protein [Mycobacteroides abscessus subsp. abscessus]|nr:Uncharacterised protein [Mycobacteroides abscessus subsp. abscessus]SHV82478.1 Uncharacterised protein [Mycobacteroides abscessus subsp. abscessus]SHV85638.1 Uncharacterised protein [Mycobacteroides abscessus subsp. abscessus]SHW52919.1 Uncharacterised protein [Mycobacteroides abscessus subsp. abscessus]SHY22495.1 Uncharacterised protein [Mycobacteroides abscessus subsp. abscessus]